MRVLTVVACALGHVSITGAASSTHVTTSTILTRWIPSKSMPIPTRGLHTAPAYRREDLLHVESSFTGCSSGYISVTTTAVWETCTRIHGEQPKCTNLSTSVGPVCTQTACPNGYAPRLPVDIQTSCSRISSTGHWTCAPSTKSWTDTSSCVWTASVTRTDQRRVEQVAKATPASSTNGGRSQRAVAAFAQATPKAPICSFNPEQGVYVCPTPVAPPCVFDREKGEYVCDGVNTVLATPAPEKKLVTRVCPPGVDMCGIPVSSTPLNSSSTRDIYVSETGQPGWTATPSHLTTRTTKKPWETVNVPFSSIPTSSSSSRDVFVSSTKKLDSTATPPRRFTSTTKKPWATPDIPPPEFSSTRCSSGRVGPGCDAHVSTLSHVHREADMASRSNKLTNIPHLTKTPKSTTTFPSITHDFGMSTRCNFRGCSQYSGRHVPTAESTMKTVRKA
ncbi:hypothetical protein BKA63DRAFT_491926 [Paraphoma chrysanthemicola]|nr:hypothetical protein BKA63DRAFT_491926 [Paraphoma chrysanthemicola]